ncbi:MAG: iron-regulated protein [Methylibium sp.]|uniref:imelysin family protein n=1 Tax=Methylibium sp. TaxID=2067992 RepID=UPI0017982D63|nr:imelysin family protein [Methylibium sp.]MBA3598294.1 iron-regulated protein [Methylibium sp.]
MKLPAPIGGLPKSLAPASGAARRSTQAASLLLALAFFCALPALAQTTLKSAPAAAATAKASPDLSAVLTHHATLVHASYLDTLTAARSMQQQVEAFAARPSAAGLQATQQAWRAAREFYGQTEAFRFYGGPIDGDDGPEGRLNAWPMDESYVDRVEGRPDSGLIADRSFIIDKTNLAAQNERGGEENVATGWHAIEFLLWGQDVSENGPGQRSFEDFVDGKAPNADRRRQYLRVATELLIDDLGTLVQAWAPAGQNYRAAFERGAAESMRKLFVGLGSLSRGELAGERLEVALATRDQEDEHSCFSDNTHRDAATNALGIENVWLGRLRRADGSVLQGPSLRDWVARQDAALAERTSQQIAASVRAAEAIQPPFDREITGGADGHGRERIERATAALTLQSKTLVEAANAVGIERLNLVQPQ